MKNMEFTMKQRDGNLEKIIQFFYKNIMFKAASFYRGAGFNNKLHSSLMESQRWPIDKLEELQNKKLMKLIKYAYENIPYYKKFFIERGLVPEDIRSKKDLKKLPLLTKEIIKKTFDDIIVSGMRKWYPFLGYFVKNPIMTGRLFSTSGSTAEPLKFYEDLATARSSWGDYYRWLAWVGYSHGQKIAFLGSFRHSTSPLLEKLKSVCERTTSFTLFNAMEDNYYQCARKLSNFNPVIISGIPSVIYNMALFLEKHKEIKIQPKAVTTTSEKLMLHQRILIEKQFNCKVFDQYGASEGGLIAYECEKHEGYHIAMESVVVEIIKDNKEVVPGQIGEVVVTYLDKYSMPFIRYCVGDLAVASEKDCSCGRKLPSLALIEGRTRECIVTTDGRIITGQFVVFQLFERYSWVEKFQLIQENEKKIKVFIISKNVGDLEKWKREAQALFGKNMEIEISLVEQINEFTEKGKKIGPIISKVNVGFNKEY